MTALRDSLVRIEPSDYSKYQALLDGIQGGRQLDWRPTETMDRLVIFTERIATLNWLSARLATDLMLKPGQVEILHGDMSDIEQQRVVEDFGNTQRPVRLLLCSDVASEGINLHYLALAPYPIPARIESQNPEHRPAPIDKHEPLLACRIFNQVPPHPGRQSIE